MRLRSVAFATAAALLPFALLFTAEMVLRLTGIDEEAQRPFRPIGSDSSYLAFNPSYTSRYFTSFVPAVAFNPFLRAKEPGSFRVIVLGGSSTAGFPYSFYYAFPARLMERLERYALGQRIEVINLGMTAVNSYTLWDLKDAVVEQQPDVVVIYAGHNEYYGAFGTGSSEYGLGTWMWPKRLLLSLKSFVLFRLMEGLIVGKPAADSNGQDSRTMMARVVRNARITMGGSVFNAGLRQFRSNIGEVLATFRDASIPVFIGTLASNLKDQPPLGDNPRAMEAYRRGTAQLASGDTSAAAISFSAARDWDEIRFRAPDTLNEIIRTLGTAYGATVIDIASYLAQHSPDKITGESLFDDHLHPNSTGYDLIAEAFFKAISRDSTLFRNELAESMSNLPKVDPIERAEAKLQMVRLKGGYPFDKEVTPEEERRRYLKFVKNYVNEGSFTDSLAVVGVSQIQMPQEVLRTGVRMARSRGDSLHALQISYALLNWQPFNESLIEDAVNYASENPHFDKQVEPLAMFGFTRTGHSFYLNLLAGLAIRQGHMKDAAILLDLAEAKNPDDPVMLYNKARFFIMRGDTATSRSYFARYRANRK